MGQVVTLPDYRDISPEVSKLIANRKKKAAYWVWRWSETNRMLCQVDPEDVEESVIEDASHYVMGWLPGRNRAALKAREF
jgi:hypothetical protein